MEIIIDPKSKPCPGVERALTLAEKSITGENKLYSVGKLIHNNREVTRLKKIGLEIIDASTLEKKQFQKKAGGMGFLVRAHGEVPETITKAKQLGMTVVDGTCPIVQHSQKLVEQHVREGWGVIVVGKPDHAEVRGLCARTRGNSVVVAQVQDIDNIDTSRRWILLAQSTIDKSLFDKIRVALNKKIDNLKIFDTRCKFIRKRIKEVTEFAQGFDVLFIVGGRQSSNLGLLHKAARTVVPNSHRIEKPGDIKPEWLENAVKIGIMGGASTPRWQMEGVKIYLEQLQNKKNPQGLINNKGGKLLWWIRKNRK